MEKYKIYIFIIIFCSILFIIYNFKKDTNDLIPSKPTSIIGEGYQVIDMIYQDDGITAHYPYIASGASSDKLARWNNIIKDDINKILQIYSFQPYKELQGTPSEVGQPHLMIVYEVKLLNDQFLSIFYKADYNSPYSAHPTELVYTTNIDTKTDTRLKLSNLIKLDSNFASSIRGWNFTSDQPLNDLLNKAIKDIINNMSDEDLLNGLNAADQIGTGNSWGMYSYITPVNLGISISVPNFAGDHVEFEKKLTELKDYLNPTFDWNIQK